MRRGLIAANWKMNGLKRQVDDLLGQFIAALDPAEDYEVAVCPPSVYLEQARRKLSGTSIKLAAQNVYIHEKGAFTGEISARMLVEFECAYVIVGHSERRRIFGESNELVAEKFAAAQLQGLTPILCLGETLEQREAGKTEEVVFEQLEAVLVRNGVQSLRLAVLAYEPVWAIGTGVSATPEQAQAVHELIRNKVAGVNRAVAGELRILYGGSVNSANAAALFARPDIDGALVGGASLDAGEFIAVCSHMQPCAGTNRAERKELDGRI